MNNLFDKDKAINALLYILNKLTTKKDMHKISKIFYFADQEHLAKYGRTITGDTYIAMDFGPVPSCLDDIFKAVRGDSYFSNCSEEFKKSFHFINNFEMESSTAANMDYLSKTDISCLDNAIKLCGKKSFKELVTLSHDYAWNATGKNSAMSYKDILTEAGADDDYINFTMQNMELEKALL